MAHYPPRATTGDDGDDDNDLHLEMESLMRETVGNGNGERVSTSRIVPDAYQHHNQQHQPAGRMRMLAIGMAIMIVGWILLSHRSNRIDTDFVDVNDLPKVVDTHAQTSNDDAQKNSPLIRPDLPSLMEPTRPPQPDGNEGDSLAETTPGTQTPLQPPPSPDGSIPASDLPDNENSPPVAITGNDFPPSVSPMASPTSNSAAANGGTPPSLNQYPVLPKQSIAIVAKVPEQPGFIHPPSYYSDSYVPRARKDRQSPNPALAREWGEWTFRDTKERPDLTTLFESHPNGDVPRNQFPPTAWQVDKEYLKGFLPQAIALTERALKVILAEYGHAKASDDIETVLRDATRDDPAYMFNLTVSQNGKGYNMKHPPGNAGVSSHATIRRLRLWLLHAIMTEGPFFITMGGHSSAAGHGNHFLQSYSLQLQRALEPVLARLGVFHIVRNIGMGGLGTAHNSMGSQSIYGGDNSILIWDSGMTEGAMPPRDLFARQGLLSRVVPILFGSPVSETYDVDGDSGVLWSGCWGCGFAGVPESASEEQVLTLPYAARYVICSGSFNHVCRVLGYNGVCWIDRPDVIPKTLQKPMGGRAKWHPGNGYHQLTSRLYAFPILKILRQALLDWYAMDDYALPDDEWHVTPHYEKTWAVLKALNSTPCFSLNLNPIACDVPMQGRSEFTPRAYPAETSIRSILQPGVKVPGIDPNEYDPPDVYNPAFHPPDGEIDYLAVVENGIQFQPIKARRDYMNRIINPPSLAKRAPASGLVPGQGWIAEVNAAADNCDGTHDSFCNRVGACLLYGHNDGRGGLKGDVLSGWLLMSLNDVKHGLIMINGDPSAPYSVGETLGWKCENNAETCLNPISEEESTAPSSKKSECGDWRFEFAIDGKVTTWTLDEYNAQIKAVERLINVVTLLDDRAIVEDGKTRDIELGIRVGGSCGRAATYRLTQVYWA